MFVLITLLHCIFTLAKSLKFQIQHVMASNTLYIDSKHTDEERRKNLFAGNLYVYKQLPAVMELVQLARTMIEDAFGGRNPELAQHDMDVNEFEALLNKLKPAFVNDPEGKKIMKRILAQMGCDVEKTYFDLPRMRTSTSDNYLTTGIAYTFDAHRDTWFSGPLCQVNWWFPIYDVSAENAMLFYPEYFQKHLRNGSFGYDCHEWNKTSRLIAAGEIKEDKRKRPMPLENVSPDNQMVIIPEVGSMIVFAGSHLHASIPNHSGRTRYSIDFRTVNLDDAEQHIGSPNIDNYCSGTIMRDFIHPSTYELLPKEIIMSYEQGTPVQDPIMERESK